MKVLVTGGAGYIGGVVTHALIEAGHEVVVLDDLSQGYADNIPTGIEFHQLSVHEISRVLTADAGFDGVLHFAGKLSVEESVARPDLYWDVNVVGTIAVLTAMRAAGTPRHHPLLLLCPLFALLCWLNCVAIEDWEQHRGGNRVGWLAGLAMAASGVSLLDLANPLARWLAVAIILSSALFLVLDRSLLRAGGRRIAADLALLTPVLLLVAGPLAR